MGWHPCMGCLGRSVFGVTIRATRLLMSTTTKGLESREGQSGTPPQIKEGVGLRDQTSRRILRKITLVLILNDVLLVLAALFAAYMIRFGGAAPPNYLLLIFIAPAVWVVISYAYGLYQPWRMSGLDELRGAVGATSVAV